MGVNQDGFVPYKGELALEGMAFNGNIPVTVRSQVIRYSTSTPSKVLRLDIKVGYGEDGLLFSANTALPSELDPHEIGHCMSPDIVTRFMPKIQFGLVPPAQPKKGKRNEGNSHCRLHARPEFREGVDAKVEMTKAILPSEAESFFVLISPENLAPA